MLSCVWGYWVGNTAFYAVMIIFTETDATEIPPTLAFLTSLRQRQVESQGWKIFPLTVNTINTLKLHN